MTFGFPYVVRGLKRQQDAALTNFVGCFFLLYLISFFSSLALNDLAGPKRWAFGPKNIILSYLGFP